MNNTFALAFLKELESEAAATRKCLERIPETLFEYKPHDKSLPGKPDIVLPKYRTAIFVHGCFWHGHGWWQSLL